MHTPVNKRKVRQEHTLSEFYGVYIVSQLSCLKEGERATLTFSFAGSQLVQIPGCVCVCKNEVGESKAYQDVRDSKATG